MSAAPLSVLELEDVGIDIIWHNIYRNDDENFLGYRRRSKSSITHVLIEFGKLVEMGIFEQVLSVNASQHMFCVTVACTKRADEVIDLIASIG